MIETHKSFCRFCHVFCGVEVDVEDGRILSVRGDPDNPVTRGYTCQKGRAETERIHHPDRLLASLRRTDAGLVETDNDQALDEIASRLRKIIDEHGPDSVAVYVGCGGHRTSAGGPWFVRKWLDAIGSKGMYTSMTIDSPAMYLAMDRLFGSPIPVNQFDIDNAEVAMFVASNPLGSHFMTMPQSSPAKRLKDAQKRGLQLIVLDPRKTDVARRADIHLQVKPGEDATLLAGIIKVIIEESLFDADYVSECVSGVDALGEAVADFDLDYVEQRTGVPKDDVVAAARMFATARTGGAQSGTGLHMARHQNLNTQLVMTLNALCGRYDRKGGMVRNRGVLGVDVPEGIGPGRSMHFTGETSRIRGIRGTFSLVGFFNEMPTNTLTDEILTPGKGQIRALIVNGGNPALVFPDAASTQRALQELDLLVVNDLFVSATAEHADYVLAVKHPFERTDVTRMMDGNFPFPFGQHTPPLIDPPEGVLEEYEIFWELAKRLEVALPIPGISMETLPSSDEMIDGLHPHARFPVDELRGHPSGRAFGDSLTAGGMLPNMLGHPDGKMAAGHPEVIAELREVRAEPVLAKGGYEAGEDFDFRMITYRMKEVYCTQGQNLPSLRGKRPFNPCLMHPEAMLERGLSDGDRVTVDSGFGQVEAIVETSDAVGKGTVALAFGWGDPTGVADVREVGSCVEQLIPDDVRFDPVTGLAQQSAVPVNIRPLA
jgi:anaerobic selenocysteine-containing dehydrogenase